MTYLRCLPPSVEPRVSDHIPQIIDMIKQVVSLSKSLLKYAPLRGPAPFFVGGMI